MAGPLTDALIGPRRVELIEDVEYVTQTYRVTTGAAQDDEYIVTGYSDIVAVVGCVQIDAAASETQVPFFVKNARGTSIAADTNAGDLGIEQLLASTYEVTVFCQV